MAEITRSRTGELVRGVFKVLLPESEGLPAKEVLERVQKVVPPTEFENSTYPNRPNVRRYEKIIRFSTITSVKAGWLLKNKGLWTLTEEGKKAFDRYRDPELFVREARTLYKKWKDEQPDEDKEDGGDPVTTLEEAEEAAWTEIEEYLMEMNPFDFQDLFAGLLRGMGYHVSWVSPPGPDKGVDVIAYSDPLGIKGPRIKAQVKRRSDKINVEGIRSFMAQLAEGDVGLFMATGGFTKDAEDEARRQEKRKIMLLDLKRLFDLWVEHYTKVPETQRRLLPLRAIYYLAPSD